MPKSSLVLVLVAFLLTGLVVPTGASGSDQLWAEPAVVVEPHDGPNGQYATINGDGELEIDLSTPGLNADAITVVNDLFYVTNNHEAPVGIWFSHSAMDKVELTINGQAVQSEDQAATLSSGERASVGVTVDTSAQSIGDVVLSEFTIHTKDQSEVEPDASGQPSGGSGEAAGETDVPTDEPEDPVTAPVSDDDEVVFADGTVEGVEIRNLPTENVNELRVADAPPKAAIDAEAAPRSLESIQDSVRPAEGADALVEVGERVRFTGVGTVFSSVDAIQPNGQVVRLVEIDVPAGRQDSPAYVRLVIERSQLGDSDPTEARIGRFTGQGWQLLDTTVLDADNERVVLQARTTGFGTFAIFPDPSVSYRWETQQGVPENNQVVIDEHFNEPGLRVIELRVTDAVGRTSTTEFSVLANDRPSVTIEGPASVAPGEPATLRANVTNEVGNVTITWTFADGTTVTGQSVERMFETGEHLVSVEVVDEYGATARSTVTLAVGSPADDGRVTIELFQLSLSVEERLVYAAILIFLLIAFIREVGSRGQRTRAR